MRLYLLRSRYNTIGIFDLEHANQYILLHLNDGKMNDMDVLSCDLNSVGQDMDNFVLEYWNETGIVLD